ncbi:bleomycin resistance protein [Haloechinothrix sp. YIM 98757]|uniref:Bleomycin resistance protein n=1 Tax=Haloechinothrix aidingensis TaxID=2752311 RepID=A0A838ABE6_9PSEU|nr:bleomycin resistance protein [Haloechinothrix aidingensis]MBA0126563.1 bleomycin resistance protein [Haloechinothrix aidingensis]
MNASRMNPILPVSDLPHVVAVLTSILGRRATFVDGERWAQFDLGGGRLALAAGGAAEDGPALAVKVSRLDATVARLRADGYRVGDTGRGPHERSATVTVDGATGWSVVLYEPLEP